MHILLLADGRSPITLSWIKTLHLLKYRISLVSTYPCAPINGVELAGVLPVAFAHFGGSQAGRIGSDSKRKGLTRAFRPLLAQARHALGPWTVSYYRRKFARMVDDIKPDLVQALRVPYEGMVAAATTEDIPLVVSTWGNDFTLHARANGLLGRITRQTMNRADALMSDTRRDALLAREWGFAADKPSMVVVGNGGLDLEAIRQVSSRIPRAKPPQILNPRGLRSYVRSDTFFRMIPLVLAKFPDIQFVCPSMAGQKEALDWVERLGITKNVQLLPFLSQEQLWQEYAKSAISVSLSEHDGTPNTLLEAMAFGCLPLCGDIPSIREWIEPGVNGALVDPGDPEAAAAAVIGMLADLKGHKNWVDANHQLVSEKADRLKLSGEIGHFYQGVVK